MSQQSVRLHALRERLEKLESRLQKLIEGSARRVFPGAPVSDLLARRLLQAVQAGLHLEAEGQASAPDTLILFISPGEFELLNHTGLAEKLETALRAGGRQAGVRFPAGPFLQVQADAALATGEVRVATHENRSVLSSTNDMTAQASQPELPLGAYLIVDGTRMFPLEQPVINIGRRPDNQLVIDDPRVSRTHAQMRLLRGQHVIFDLDSSGGTWVNGQPVRQQALRAGDVILLAGLPLVYGRESQDLGETQEYALES